MLLRVFVGAHGGKHRCGRPIWENRILTAKRAAPARAPNVASFDGLASAQQHDDGAAAAGVTSGLAIGEDVVPLR